MLLQVFRVCLREPLSILIKYNTTAETLKIDNMINFISTFRLFFSDQQERNVDLITYYRIYTFSEET